ncbi:Piso0_003262 [Millerozyma farinosa CBS 7064]|uniref:Protoheme IX farnesyltransferase, mitochondrial n=1 Tax=Pichia sorbitophila (strain ATCC MYA-4447 / BCRC 22081 / CBS 7064 / NBRC 10061 / NRRL Y-12695) TaxID=559304 RepID=G8YHM3_PICSO|nr:Piso0_003262 [Millerozyma farinosa CBS 7064]CCE80925.1 Piso0_003262 [Millerozyma farinosa CBS 7064]
MSQKVIIARFNRASNFNFFFNNTKKKLNIKQNFIGNQFLIIKSRLLFDKSSLQRSNVQQPQQPNDEGNPNTLLEDVASKVLSCQEPEAKSSQKSSHTENCNPLIPFKVIPKNPSKISNTIPSEKVSLKCILSPYIKLTKPNLTTLVTLSAICSYAISPNSVSLQELMFLAVGTALCSGAANAINMGREPNFDRMMPRTVSRPVVRGLVSPTQAYAFASVAATLGFVMLYYGVNPTVSYLGLSNIILYAWLYTSLKRVSIINTWVGAIVGAIPPLMGWAASSSLADPGGWCLAALLYAWQFPHFNALSHNIADQYKNAGYVMTASVNPMLNARVALRYSLLMFPICFLLTYYGVTDTVFQLDSSIVNAWLAYGAFKFWKQQRHNYSNNGSPTAEGLKLSNMHAKKLFWCSVWQLPIILILAMLHKKGQWDKLLIYMSFKETKTEEGIKPISRIP